jgi:hypothetical protein
MAKRSYSCSGSSNGNNNADHLRSRATHGNGSASSSDGEDDHDSMPPRKLLKSNGLQLRNAENFIIWAALIVQLTILCYICGEEVNWMDLCLLARSLYRPSWRSTVLA